MGVGHLALELELRLFRLARARHHRAQCARERFRIGEGRAGAGRYPLLAVAADECDVDAVHRRAAYDAEGGVQRFAHRLSA